MRRGGLQIIARGRMRAAQECKHAHDVRAEHMRGLDGVLEQLDMRGDFIRRIKVALEDRRSGPRDGEPGDPGDKIHGVDGDVV